MNIRLSTDFLTGLLFVALGAFAIAYGWNYPIGTSARMGPGYYPYLVSILLIIVGAVLVVRSFVVETETIGEIPLRPLVAVLTGVLAFGLLIERAGLVVSTLVLIVAARLADRDFRPLEVALLSAVLLGFATAVFWYGLSLPFPLLPPAFR